MEALTDWEKDQIDSLCIKLPKYGRSIWTYLSCGVQNKPELLTVNTRCLIFQLYESQVRFYYFFRPPHSNPCLSPHRHSTLNLDQTITTLTTSISTDLLTLKHCGLSLPCLGTSLLSQVNWRSLQFCIHWLSSLRSIRLFLLDTPVLGREGMGQSSVVLYTTGRGGLAYSSQLEPQGG